MMLRPARPSVGDKSLADAFVGRGRRRRDSANKRVMKNECVLHLILCWWMDSNAKEAKSVSQHHVDYARLLRGLKNVRRWHSCHAPTVSKKTSTPALCMSLHGVSQLFRRLNLNYFAPHIPRSLDCLLPACLARSPAGGWAPFG